MKIVAWIRDMDTGKLIYVRTANGLCWFNGKGDLGAFVQAKLQGIS